MTFRYLKRLGTYLLEKGHDFVLCGFVGQKVIKRLDEVLADLASDKTLAVLDVDVLGYDGAEQDAKGGQKKQ